MNPSVQRISEVLEAAGLPAILRSYPEETRTAADAAAAIGVDVGQIVKSLVFAAAEPVLVLTSGANRVDEQRLATLVGAPVRRADPGLVRAATGYAIGGVPPIGHVRPLQAFVDEDLLGYEVVWAAAGTPRDVFAIAPAELVRLSAGQVAAVAAR